MSGDPGLTHDTFRIVPLQVLMERRFAGIETYVVTRCPRHAAQRTLTTRHALIRHRAGARMKQRQPLVHAMAALLKRLGVKTTVDGTLFTSSSRPQNFVTPPAATARRKAS